MTQKSRRKVLKGIAATVPATWATPVVQSVVTPAHAATTPDGTFVPNCSSPPDSPENVENGICADLDIFGDIADCVECNDRISEWLRICGSQPIVRPRCEAVM